MKIKEAIEKLVDLYKSNEVFQSDPNSPELAINFKSMKNLFSNYACVDFAYAVNKLKGWDIYHFEFFENDEQEYAPYHVISKVEGEDLYFDINGFSTYEEIIERFNGNIDHVEKYQIKPSKFMIRNDKDIEAISQIARYLINNRELENNKDHSLNK